MEIGWKEEMVNLLLDVIDKGLMNEETISQFTYNYLAALLETTYQLENGKEFYRKIKSYLENINIRRLRAQIKAKEKIIVGFIANYASSWIGDELYHLLNCSEEFEPYVFLIANHAPGQSDEEIKKEYAEHLEYFGARDMRVVQTLDLDSGVQYTWEQIGIKPQLCIWLTPWTALFREHFHLLLYSMDTVHTYIPYGIMIADNENGNFVYDQYDQLLHNMAWKNFEESKIAVDMARKYSFVGGRNAVYTGCPKMDGFYEKDVGEVNLWEALIKKSGNSGAKRIIYAPHHTLGDDEPLHFSTFASNYMFMVELAEKYQNETVWVFKPHPHLKYKAVKEGIFANMEEWYAYEQRWKNLENAEVMKEGMYHGLFMESDAMILDSISFLAEYLYVHKPLLMLRRDGQFYNDFGKQLMEIHYSAEGTDTKSIEQFLTDVVLAENDKRKKDREQFFIENLDYVRMTGKNAAANIFTQLKEGLMYE